MYVISLDFVYTLFNLEVARLVNSIKGDSLNAGTYILRILAW